jgi:hypothetical protein
LAKFFSGQSFFLNAGHLEPQYAAIKNAQDSPDLFKKPMLFEKKTP